jgi:PhnB protein
LSTITTHLSFNGQCREAFETYAKILGGAITFSMTYAGSPMEEMAPPEYRDRIMHASLAAGGTTLSGNDDVPGQYKTPQRFAVAISPKTIEEAELIFNALAEGGTIHMPLAETFWAARFGYLVDRFGIPWMINCEKPRES